MSKKGGHASRSVRSSQIFTSLTKIKRRKLNSEKCEIEFAICVRTRQIEYGSRRKRKTLKICLQILRKEIQRRRGVNELTANLKLHNEGTKSGSPRGINGIITLQSGVENQHGCFCFELLQTFNRAFSPRWELPRTTQFVIGAGFESTANDTKTQ